MKQSNGYLVISVKTLNKLIKRARNESKSLYGKIKGECNIVLELVIEENDKYKGTDGSKQINLKRIKAKTPINQLTPAQEAYLLDEAKERHLEKKYGVDK